jgi:hypothetical protein
VRLAVAALVILPAGGCSSPDIPADRDAGVIGCAFNCQDVVLSGPLAATVQGVLSVNCANQDGCHGAAAGHLPMPSRSEFSSLINVASFEAPTLLRVKPGDPAKSYLYLKVACDAGPIEASCMPPGAPLSQSLVQAFHDWIEAGAPTQ